MKKISFIVLSAMLSACSMHQEKTTAALPKIEHPIALQSVWQKKLGQGAAQEYLKLVPAVGKQALYSIDKKGLLTAVDKKTSRTLWQKDYEQEVTAGVLLSGSVLSFGTLNGEIHAVSAKDGRELWHHQLSSEILALPTYHKHKLFTRTIDGKLYALSTKGNILWEYQGEVPAITLRAQSRVAVDDHRIYLPARDGSLRAIGLDDGIVQWEAQIARPQGHSLLQRMVDIVADPIVKGDTVYLAGYQGKIAAVDTQTGVMRWSRDISTYSGLAIKNDHLVLTDVTGQVWAIDTSTGTTLWRQARLLHHKLGAPSIVGDKVYFGDAEGNVHVLALKNGVLLAHDTISRAPILSAPVVRHHELYIAGNDGQITAYQTS